MSFLPDSAQIRVTVSPAQADVDYICSCLPGDEIDHRKNGEIADHCVLEAQRQQ
jgi:hypothetical protein